MRVGLSLGFDKISIFSIGSPYLFQMLFFLWVGGGGGGGGGLLKVLGKTERTGKFGKIALIIFFFSLIWIEFI